MKTKILIFILVIVVAGLVFGRLMLPIWTKNYVNKVISNLNGYTGAVEQVEIHLWRGAYSLHNLKINKKEGDIPIPFLDIPVMDLAVEWRALLNGRVVAVIKFQHPVINFAISPNGKNSQTGKEANWADSLDKLVPIDINLLTAQNGTVTYKDFSSNPKVDIAIKNMALEARNLRNVEDKKTPLPSPFKLTGRSIGNGDLNVEGNINILKNPTDFSLDGKLEKVNLPAFNDYTRAYAAVDFKAGTLNIYTELAVKNGKVSGYVKPLATDISFIDLSKNDKGPLNLMWQSIVATFATIFKNHPKDQLATTVPLEGDISNPQIAVWPTLAGIFKNAFIKALSNKIDNTVNFKDSPEK
jgi:hypothetical protein